MNSPVPNSPFKPFRPETDIEVSGKPVLGLRRHGPRVSRGIRVSRQELRAAGQPHRVCERHVGGGNFFRNLNLASEEFTDLEMKDKMAPAKDDVQKRLKAGEKLWRLADEHDHNFPVYVRLYRNLPNSLQSTLRAEAALMCQEIFQGSRKRRKYDGIAIDLLARHGALAPNARDLFSAGSVAGPE